MPTLADIRNELEMELGGVNANIAELEGLVNELERELDGLEVPITIEDARRRQSAQGELGMLEMTLKNANEHKASLVKKLEGGIRGKINIASSENIERFIEGQADRIELIKKSAIDLITGLYELRASNSECTRAFNQEAAGIYADYGMDSRSSMWVDGCETAVSRLYGEKHVGYLIRLMLQNPSSLWTELVEGVKK